MTVAATVARAVTANRVTTTNNPYGPVTRLLLLMSLLSFLGCGHPTPSPSPQTNGRHGQLMKLEYGGTHGYHAYSNIDFRAERLKDGRTRITVMVGNDRDRVFEEESSTMDSLEAIVYAYKMYKYDGSYTPRYDVLDGDSWHLSMDFADGEHQSCHGYEATPPGKGGEGLGKIEGFFSRWLNQEPAEEVALVSFRYELHTEEGDEVLWFKKDEDRCPVYFRMMGSNEGWNYYCGDPDLAIQLARAIRWCHMASYTGEKLEKEDKSLPRWVLIAEYENGQKIEDMDYLDRDLKDDDWHHGVPSLSERELRYEAERLFGKELSRIQQLQPEELGRHSCTTYDAQGKPSRTINYAGDGTVLGGRDYNDPDLDF